MTYVSHLNLLRISLYNSTEAFKELKKGEHQPSRNVLTWNHCLAAVFTEFYLRRSTAGALDDSGSERN